MTYGKCLENLNPSVSRHGDLVLGGFSPLEFLNQERAQLWISFVLKRKQKLTLLINSCMCTCVFWCNFLSVWGRYCKMRTWINNEFISLLFPPHFQERREKLTSIFAYFVSLISIIPHGGHRMREDFGIPYFSSTRTQRSRNRSISKH